MKTIEPLSSVVDSRFAPTPAEPQRSTMKIAIVGLGYVGLPLSLQFARSGVKVLGLDIDPAKVALPQPGAELHQTHRIVRHRRGGEGRQFCRHHGLCAHPGSGGGHHLRADAAEQEPRAGHFLHH